MSEWEVENVVHIGGPVAITLTEGGVEMVKCIPNLYTGAEGGSLTSGISGTAEFTS